MQAKRSDILRLLAKGELTTLQIAERIGGEFTSLQQVIAVMSRRGLIIRVSARPARWRLPS